VFSDSGNRNAWRHSRRLSPPPPPEFIDEIAKQVVAMPSANSFDSYAGLLANKLVVTVDGKQVTTTKAGWLALERLRLEKSIGARPAMQTVATRSSS
jgi:hypothetical protein